MSKIYCDQCQKAYKSQLTCKACGQLMTIQPPPDGDGTPAWLYMVCDQCGKKFKAKATCQLCNGPVSISSPPKFEDSVMSESPEEQHEQLVLDDDGSGAQRSQKSTSSSSKWLVLVLIVLIVLAIGAFVYFGLPLK